MNPMTQALLGVFISLITSWLTVKFSLAQFRSQRWWERKADTYSDIVKHLSILEYTLGKLVDDFHRGVRFSEDEEKKLYSQVSKSRETILQVASGGAYILSDEAADTLKALRGAIEESVDAQDYYAALEGEYFAVRKCLRELRGYAKADLQLAGGGPAVSVATVTRRLWRTLKIQK